MRIKDYILDKSKLIDKNECIWILEKVLCTDYTSIISDLEAELSTYSINTADKMVEKVKNNCPIQYVLGEWSFIDIELRVDKRGLIPRPETELLAKKAVELCMKFQRPRVIDIGCGTGCIGLYIKKHVQSAEVILCDVSKDAIELSRYNAGRLAFDVMYLNQDMKDIKGEYDIIVSNPPYISKDDMNCLSESVKKYEPKIALYGGEDGLKYYRIFGQMNKILSRDGLIALEIGMNQSSDVSDILKQNFDEIETFKDISNLDRIIVAKIK